MKNKIVCIVGMAGAGKSIVSDEIVSNGFAYLRFGQITADWFKKRKIKPTEAREREIREKIRKKYGMAAFAILNIQKIDELLKKSNVVVDGLYSWSEYKIMKEKYGESMFVIAVYAPPRLRYKRLAKRNSKNDKDLRFRPLRPEEAITRDYSEIENLEKGGPIAMADFTIINTGTIKELKERVKEILKTILNKRKKK